MNGNYGWWNALVHGGCLISPARLEQHISDETIEMAAWRMDRLRRAQERFNARRETGAWIETVLEDALGHRVDRWPSVSGDDWSVRLVTGESYRPRRVYDPEGHAFPLFVADSERIGVGRGRRDVARVIEWLRRKDLNLALLTNGRQWRIVYAGETADAWAESSIENWFTEGAVAPALDALRHLLSAESLSGPLEQAVIDTRKGQSELSAALGERVRQAVELLIVACRKECDLALDGGEVSLGDLYTAGVRMIMRIVVLMFAESRELLPLSEEAYYRSYSLRNLLETLEHEGHGEGGNQRLRPMQSAWPRIVGLCRLVHKGSPHSRLAVPEYGGELFLPGNPTGKGIERALAAIENSVSGPTNLDVRLVLNLITQSPLKIRQGRGVEATMFPVDFSQIDTEYIGILYEGLLDYELRRAAEDQPQIILGIGDQPILPLRRLEAMDDKALRELLEKMKVKAKSPVAAGEGDEEDNAEDEEEGAELEEAEDEVQASETILDIGDRYAVRQAAAAWAKRAAIAGKMVKKNAPQSEVDTAVKTLVVDVRAPGEYYLVRFGGTRKGSGTFYTVPALASPTVRRTLDPLLRDENGPKTPDAILSLKVCDPACGSGSFPLAALRLINEALFESLLVHGWLVEVDGRYQRGTSANETPEWLRDALSDMPGLNEPYAAKGQDERIKARLKRHVVERCLYGVDINRLAVELTRVALWVETMDPRLPFSFLDHKFKVGNALVGCWFDRFQDYPLLAWLREGGDKTHPTSIHHTAGTWTKAIAEAKKDAVDSWRSILMTGTLLPEYQAPEVHEEAREVYESHLHMRVHEPAAQKRLYEELRQSSSFKTLKFAFDAWCAVWFWPAEHLGLVSPTPTELWEAISIVSQELEDVVGTQTGMMISWVNDLARQHEFFHWELEFPDVFAGDDPGFDAVVGNPPWEIRKPNSKEWFSNLDPLYRSYGKQLALEKQRELFESVPGTEHGWLQYNADLKATSNWVRSAGDPFGRAKDPNSEEKVPGISFSRSAETNRSIFRLWEAQRKGRAGYAPLPHPFVSQGSADINTYKLFLEQSISVARREGRIGLIVPSGLCTDRGSVALRDRFLDQCRWEWLFGFENRDGIFAIHRSFKFCPVIIQKGGCTDSIKTAFMRRDLADWEAGQPETLLITREQIHRFSPRSHALLEIRDPRDVEVLETMTQNGVPLGETGDGGWGVSYATEFHMTNDSKLFPPRPDWERQGYVPDEYGHWLKGAWSPIPEGSNTSEQGQIRSRDEQQCIRAEQIEDVALPLYQGAMINQFDPMFAEYDPTIRGKKKWRNLNWLNKVLAPQFLMHQTTFHERGSEAQYRLIFRDIANPTNQRTMLASLAPPLPCNNKAPRMAQGNLVQLGALCAVLNSYVLDGSLRLRFGVSAGAGSLNPFILNELVLPRRVPAIFRMSGLVFALNCFPTLLRCTVQDSDLCQSNAFALTGHERLRLRVILDSCVAHFYGLGTTLFAYLLRDCDHELGLMKSDTFTAALDAKGFWRVDKQLDPELRHTVLAQVAFADLQALIADHGEDEGLRRFLGTGPDDGWMLPDTLRLADYGLGHDDRAQHPQPVASRLGPRFYDWQLQQTPEESWAECQHHAANIRAIRSIGTRQLKESEGDNPSATSGSETPASGRNTPKPTTGNLFEPPHPTLFES